MVSLRRRKTPTIHRRSLFLLLLLPFVVFSVAAFSFLQRPAPLQQAAPDDNRGEEVFSTICAACHSLKPPMKTAPPMLMVVQHYFEKYETIDEVRKAMRAWIPTPNKEDSGLPEHAIERFGLMPPLQLPQSDIDAVVDYLIEEHGKADMEEMHMEEAEDDQAGKGMMMGRGMQMGQGMKMEHGMQNQEMTQERQEMTQERQEMMHQGMMLMMRGMMMMQQGMMGQQGMMRQQGMMGMQGMMGQQGMMSENMSGDSMMGMQMNCPMHQQHEEEESEN